MKSKIGAGHVEMILSFVIFVGFLIFLFVIFNPFELVSQNSLVDSVFFNMDEEITTIVTSFSIKFNNNPTSGNCYQMENHKDLGCEVPLDKIRVRDKSMTSRDADIGLSNLKFTASGDDFYSFICSSEVDASPPTTGSCTPVTFGSGGTAELGIISEKKLWSMKKLNEFKTEYDNNYGEMKDKYISRGTDFGFRLWDLDNPTTPILLAGEPPKGIRVDAKTIPIDVIESDGNINKRTLTILTW